MQREIRQRLSRPEEVLPKGDVISLATWFGLTDRSDDLLKQWAIKRVLCLVLCGTIGLLDGPYWQTLDNLFYAVRQEMLRMQEDPELPEVLQKVGDRGDDADKLKSACRSALQITTAVLCDPDCKRREKMICTIVAPVRKWHGNQSRRLRSTHEIGRWMENQLKGDGVAPLCASISLLCERTALQRMGFEYIFPQDALEVGDDHPFFIRERLYAHKAASLIMSLVGFRFRRQVWLWVGWPGQAAGMSSEDEDLVQKTLNRLHSDFMNYQHMLAEAQGDTWDVIKRRSCFLDVSVIQLVKILEQCGWDLDNNGGDARRWFQKKRNTINNSKCIEDGIRRMRALETTGNNRRVSHLRMFHKLISSKALEEEHRFRPPPQWRNVPIPKGSTFPASRFRVRAGQAMAPQACPTRTSRLAAILHRGGPQTRRAWCTPSATST